jgi:hypothetical protein
MGANVHPKIAQELLGHSTMTITICATRAKEKSNRKKGIV